MKKFLACVMALAFVLAFAACGANGGEEPASVSAGAETTGAAPEPSGDTTAANAATAPVETTTEAGPETTAATTAVEESSETAAASTGNVPADTAGIIRYYNEALAKTPMRRSAYKRDMTKITGFAKAIGITIMDEQYLEQNPDVMPYVHYEEKTPAPSDLVALEAGWVKDAKSSVSGSTATLVITMKNYGLEPGFDPKPGARGYVSTLDKEAVVTQVCEIAMALAASVISPKALKEVTVTDSVFGQCDGKYTVAVDTATGKIKTLTFTGTQFAEGNAKCVLNIPLIPAAANAFVTLRGNLEGVYTPK